MTRALGLQDTTGLHRTERARDWVRLQGKDNWFFARALGDAARLHRRSAFRELISIPGVPRPVPEIGWLGVVALAAWITYAVAGLRLDHPGHRRRSSSSGFGHWENSMDLLIIILFAVVLCTC